MKTPTHVICPDDVSIDPSSSNGRTPDFESGNPGSNPGDGTTWADVGPGLLEALREAVPLLNNVTAMTGSEADCLGQAENIINSAIASAEKVESHD